jgi:hypothetical protein
MSSNPAKSDASQSGGHSLNTSRNSEYLRRYDNDALSTHLSAIRSRAREIMFEFNIPMGHLCEMARRAEQRITDTALRAEFLHTLIDVSEFGREAKRRGLGVAERGETAAAHPTEEGRTETRLFAPTAGASDSVKDGAAQDFFASLDTPGQPDRPTTSRSRRP